jgi:hypothetical protein
MILNLDLIRSGVLLRLFQFELLLLDELHLLFKLDLQLLFVKDLMVHLDLGHGYLALVAL